MATTTRNGKKRYNCTTNCTVVDRDTNQVAARFIDACGHLTPKAEVEFDNLIKVSDEVRDHNAGIKIIDVGKSKQVVVEEEWGDWQEETGPTAKELRAIERGD